MLIAAQALTHGYVLVTNNLKEFERVPDLKCVNWVFIMSEKNSHVWLSLGSNSENARQMLAAARKSIAALPGVAIARESKIYLTEPQGYAAQPWFANQTIELIVNDSWCPKELLERLLAIETALGRRRDPALRFGPRVIDIDLLLFGDAQSADPKCTLPHPRLCERAFVLVPLLDIAPGAAIAGRPAREWLAGLAFRVEGEKIWQAE